MSGKAIGIVGGVGPAAGYDLAMKVLKHTKAATDQEHIDTFVVSCPDRTAYLLSGGGDPAPGISACLEKLAACGASVAGIACNTAHSKKILDHVRIPKSLCFINMIECVRSEIERRGGMRRVGLLSTLGTLETGVYDEYFSEGCGIELVKPDHEISLRVHEAIYDREYGIKSSVAISHKAKASIEAGVSNLKSKDCEAVILGCTELPLVFDGRAEYDRVALVDPTDILAMALVRASCPEKLC